MMPWAGMQHSTGKWYLLAREIHETGFTDAVTGETEHERASRDNWLVSSCSSLTMMSWPGLRQRHNDRNRAQTRVRLEKSSLLHGVSAGNLVEFALVTTTTRNKGSGSRRCRRSARVVFPLSRTGVQVEPWRSSYYRERRQQKRKQGTTGCLIWE